MALRAPDVTVGPFREQDSVFLRATLMDNAVPPVAIPGTDLTSVTLTIYSEHGELAIINNRDHTDIKSFVSVEGVLEYQLEPADMAIVDAQEKEYHRALIEWVWDTDKRGSFEVRIVVKDVHLVS
jgi:hypothetical protein